MRRHSDSISNRESMFCDLKKHRSFIRTFDTLFPSISIEYFLFSVYSQFGHIYTSFGSFFIQPEEEYTVDNQNILHKISREKLPIKYVAKSSDIDRTQVGVSMIDDSAGDDIETIQNENDGKSYEIESTAKPVTTASTDESSAAAASSSSFDADINNDSHRESLCDTCANKGNSILIIHFLKNVPEVTSSQSCANRVVQVLNFKTYFFLD